MTDARPARPARIALAGVGLAAGLGALAYWFDLTHLDAQALGDRVRASGPVGPLFLIALLVAQAVIAPLPAPPILMAAGYVYGPWIGFAIGWFGLLVGAFTCFGLARAFGRPFAERFVRAERLAAADQSVSARGRTFVGLVALRVLVPPAFDPVSYACGVLRVPVAVFALATAVGEIPKVGSFTYVGAVTGGTPGWLTAWTLLGPALGLLGLRLVRARRARAETSARGADLA